AILSFTDGIHEEIIKRYVGTDGLMADGLWPVGGGRSGSGSQGSEAGDQRSSSDFKIRKFEIVQSAIRHLVCSYPILIKRFGSPSASPRRSAGGWSRPKFPD